jgi:paraquat-inducible protein B
VTDPKEGPSEGRVSGLPKARSIHRRWPGLVWAVPLAALIVVGWLGLSAITERGIDVVVTFESAACMST